MSTQNSLRNSKRFITAHNNDGLAIFSPVLTDEAPLTTLPDGMKVSFCYATTQFPAQLNQDQDLAAYQHLIQNPPGIVIANGSAARVVDFPPGHVGTMHRTHSVNYNFVIEGQLEIRLDSGEVRILDPGDMVVQRGINHAWRNPSQTTWARTAAVAVPAEEIIVAGQALEETGLPGMEPSR